MNRTRYRIRKTKAFIFVDFSMLVIPGSAMAAVDGERP